MFHRAKLARSKLPEFDLEKNRENIAVKPGNNTEWTFTTPGKAPRPSSSKCGPAIKSAKLRLVIGWSDIGELIQRFQRSKYALSSHTIDD